MATLVSLALVPRSAAAWGFTAHRLVSRAAIATLPEPLKQLVAGEAGLVAERSLDQLDGGPVVIQARVPVRDDDDEASLAARVLAEEHRIYAECIRWFATGRLQWRDGVVLLDGHPLTAPVVRQAANVTAA